jgi:hypothetical protein
MGLRIQFCIHLWVRPLSYPQKDQNRCSLMLTILLFLIIHKMYNNCCHRRTLIKYVTTSNVFTRRGLLQLQYNSLESVPLFSMFFRRCPHQYCEPHCHNHWAWTSRNHRFDFPLLPRKIIILSHICRERQNNAQYNIGMITFVRFFLFTVYTNSSTNATISSNQKTTGIIK